VDFSHIRTMMQNGGGSLLSIGIGQGEHKALEAVQKALNHPLLDSIPLDDAGGVIANFTGADDLTFFEVAEALTYLQEKTNMRAEIIPGISNDERMGDRTQVILVITGLGATPIDHAFSHYIQRSEHAANPGGDAPSNIQQSHTPTVEYAGSPANLDLPAFLRKRIR